MMRRDEGLEQASNPAADRRLWQRCRVMEAAEDDAARFLDLAALADERLDVEERDRVEAMVAADAEAAADVKAARRLAGSQWPSDGLDQIIARAEAIPVASAPRRSGVVVPLPVGKNRPRVPVLAQWASLAAAILLAGWLGFAMGSDASLALSDRRLPSDTGLFQELLDPSAGLLRDLGEGVRT
jgi:anti-sigma factor RsiW